MTTRRRLAWLLAAVVSAGACGWAQHVDGTTISHSNLIDILRRTQAELDATSQPPAKPIPAKPAAQVPIQPPVPPPTPPPSPVPVEPADAGEIVLGPGDVVRVTVLDEPDLSLERVALGREGEVVHSIWGRVLLSGKTVEQARLEVERLLGKDYLAKPRVELALLETKEASFTIRDKVLRPGTYSWPRQEKLTLLKAIGLAGGVTRSASSSKVTVQRVVNGVKTNLVVNLDRPDRSGDPKSFLVLPGDVIEVGAK